MQKTHGMNVGKREGVLQNRLLQWLLHRWFLLTRAMTMGVRAIVLDGEDRVLLVEHTYTPGWHLPGGGIEIGETVLDALAKELREEAGVELTGPALLHGVFFNLDMARRDHVIAFVVRDFVWAGPPQPTWEIRAARFFALDDLPADTTNAARARLAEVLADVPPGPFW